MSFDGTREYGPAPRTMTGVELLSQLEQEQIRTVYDFQIYWPPRCLLFPVQIEGEVIIGRKKVFSTIYHTGKITY